MAQAIDTSGATSIGAGVTSGTLSLTVGSGAKILYVGIVNQTGLAPDVPTWNGTAMTLVHTQRNATWMRLYAIPNPAAGTFNVGFSRTTSLFNMYVVAASYSGVDVTGGNYDAVTSLDDSPFMSNVTNLTTSLTSIADNCTFLLIQYQDNATAQTSGTSGVVKRTGTVVGLFDLLTQKTPAGSQSINVTGGSGHIYTIMISFAPAVSTTNASSFFLIM